MKHRRVFGIVIGLVLLFMLLSWLLYHQPRHTPPQKREIIRFSHFGNADDAEFWRQTIADFERANPRVRVVAGYPERMDQQAKLIRQQVQDLALTDVLLLHSAAFPEFAGHFENLTAWKPESPGGLEPVALRAFQLHDEQRGLPFSGDTLLIYVNLKSLQKASAFHGKPVELPGEDWTVAQFFRTAERLTCDFDRDGVNDQFGFRLPTWEQYLPFIWAFGAEMTDEQATRWTFSGPGAGAAMRFYRQLATGDRVTLRKEDAPQLSPETAFVSGKSGMCVNGPALMGYLQNAGLANDYVVAPIPRGPAGRATPITWSGLVMRKDLPPDQRERARRFIEWSLSKEVQGRLAHLGGALPARVDVQQEFIAADPTRRKPFVDALSYSRLQPTLPRFESVDRAITRHFGEAIDPHRGFEAPTMLEALARDPAVVGAFSESIGTPP